MFRKPVRRDVLSLIISFFLRKQHYMVVQ